MHTVACASTFSFSCSNRSAFFSSFWYMSDPWMYNIFSVLGFLLTTYTVNVCLSPPPPATAPADDDTVIVDPGNRCCIRALACSSVSASICLTRHVPVLRSLSSSWVNIWIDSLSRLIVTRAVLRSLSAWVFCASYSCSSDSYASPIISYASINLFISSSCNCASFDEGGPLEPDGGGGD